MATIKAVIKPDKKKDGTYPICIRITKDRKTNYEPVGYSATLEQWDAAQGLVRKNYPNSVRLNALIAKRISELREKAIELETDKQEVTANFIKKSTKKAKAATFFIQAELYLTGLKNAGKYNQYTADKPRVKHFKEYLKRDVPFQEIEVSTLEGFKTYVKNTLKLSERSAMNHLSMVRSVFSFARKDKIIKAEHSPFGKGKMIIKFPESGKIGLNVDEIKRLETATLPDRPNHCRNLWLFSFYFAGMRVSDVLRLRWNDFQDGRLFYVMGKNDKAGTLKVPERASKILEQYLPFKTSNNDFVFPELKGVDTNDQFIFKRTIAFKTSAIDKCLKKDVAPFAKIDKTLTMHIARHSFATEAGDKVNIQMLQKLYRHASIVTTVGYQSAFINKDADDALDAVLNPGKAKANKKKAPASKANN
ncbi:site-specific integrase [Dyadobacter sp. LJ53]|uniref:site-specific integrase n=1 Tax=Dyadobacter chenwenxiniae TaxID=2906456 RepID=UPI001F2F4241|nr:site-specific integrase [Dyadobacter chenwenxiniae]MCF0049532.1 site-specific integrase [Dyadobacter chenwenxiniae]